MFGPSVEIRTQGLLNPIQARYQTSPHPEICPAYSPDNSGILPHLFSKCNRVFQKILFSSCNKKTRLFSLVFLVREAGGEPARPCAHWHLKPASLPIPPLAHLFTWRCRSAQDLYYHPTRQMSTPFFQFSKIFRRKTIDTPTASMVLYKRK